jgi:CheY-like chemotaxis protein/HPt (histidine-containing phosphotransfer) domain-containing protein
MGGDIGVTSTLGAGSCFRFTARFAMPDAATKLPERKRAPAAGILRNRRVLVAEDNPINQQLALEFLQRAGAVVEIAETGIEAIAKATTGEHDVVLMDIHMPELDGLEATRRLRDQGSTLPIIAVSADALATSQTAAREAGCDAYVAKPINFDQLLAALTEVLPETGELNLGRRATDRAEADTEAAAAPAVVPAEAERAPTLPIRRVPGIDVGEAIRAHNGNVKLMIKLMGDFGGYYGDAGGKVRAMVIAGELEEAERLAHNLHGVAGSFGAARLKEASKTLELALARRDSSNLLGHVQSFEVALTEVLASAAALAADEVRFRASDYGSEAPAG